VAQIEDRVNHRDARGRPQSSSALPPIRSHLRRIRTSPTKTSFSRVCHSQEYTIAKMTRACSALSCVCCFRPRGSDAASAPPASSAPIPLESLESLQRPPSPYFSRSFRPGDGHHTTVTNNGTTQLSGPFGTSQYRLPETAQPSQISRPSTGNQQADPDTQGSDDGFDPTLYENLPYSGAVSTRPVEWACEATLHMCE
jgi:hypothetical protein